MHPLEMPPTITVQEVLAIAFRSRGKILLALIVPLVLAGVALLVLAPIYRAETSLIVKTGREYMAGTQGESGTTAPTSTKQEEVNSEVAIMTNRAVVEQVINKVGLAALYPSIDENPPSNQTKMDAAVTKFEKSLVVDPVKLSNVIDVTFEHTDRDLAARALDTLIAAFQAKHAEVYVGNRATAYDEGMRQDLADLDRLQKQREQIKLDNHVYDIEQQRAAYISQLVDAQNHLQELSNQSTTLSTRIAYLTKKRSALPNTISSTNTLNNDEMAYAQNALSDLRRTETGLLARYSPDHPQVQQVENEIRAIKGRIASLQGAFTSVKTDPDPLAQQVDQELVQDQAELAPLADETASYVQLSANLKSQLAGLESADTQLRAIESKIDNLNENLKTLRANYEQARALDDMDRARVVSVSQIGPAIASEKPVKPQKIVFLGGGLMIGLIAAAGIVVFAIITNNTFVTIESVERVLKLPVLMSVPRLPMPKGHGNRQAAA
jgi:polysaccharide biosynthesis protein PslE